MTRSRRTDRPARLPAPSTVFGLRWGAPLGRTCLALAGALALAGCVSVSSTTPPNPYGQVPAPIAEQMPLPPVSGEPLIWQPGHWDWAGSSYRWTPGAWVQRAGHGTLWQDGYWAQTQGGWRWVPGHWT